MPRNKVEEGTEWIFCKGLSGKCSGVSPDTVVLEKVKKSIKVHGKEIRGWMVKIAQVNTEGHLNLDLTKRSDE